MDEVKKEPLYQKIEGFIVGNIETRIYRHNEKIPSESELCEQFGASRMTVNKALTNLSKEGYIERIPGRGSFVRAFRVERIIPEMLSFSEELRRTGIQSESRLTHYSVVSLDKFPIVATKMGVPTTEMVHYFVRLRCGDGKPLAVSYNYLLVRIVPMLDINCLESSLYSYLEEQLKLELSHNDTVIQMVKPTKELKGILNLSEDAQLVQSTHVSYLADDEVFEYTETFYNSKQYSFRYRCYRK